MSETVANPSPLASPIVETYAWSDQCGEFAAALATAQGQMSNAAKDSENPHFRSKYADLASVIDAVRPHLSAVGICFQQFPTTKGKVVSVTTIFRHKSNQWTACTLTAEARASDPQSVGSAVTYLRRYGLMAMAGIAPAEDDDGNGASQPPPQAQHAPRQVIRPGPDESPLEAALRANGITLEQFGRWRTQNGKPALTSLSAQDLTQITNWVLSLTAAKADEIRGTK